MKKLKLWELDKSKRYVDRDGDVFEWCGADWVYKEGERSARRHLWSTIENLEFTEHEPRSEKRKLIKDYAYKNKYGVIVRLDADKGGSVDCLASTFTRAPEYDLTFEDK